MELINNWSRLLQKPADLALASVLLVIWLIVCSWIWIMFVIFASHNLGVRRIGQEEGPIQTKHLIKESLRSLLPVSILKLFVFALNLVIFFSSRQFSLKAPSLEADWLIGGTVTFGLLALLAYAEVFASFFIILYRRRVFSAFKLALDLLARKWRTILGGSLVALGIYLVSSAGVFFLIWLWKLAAESAFGGFNLFMAGTAVISWLCAAFISAFFYTGVVLFFSEIVKPPFDPLAKQEQKSTLVPAEGLSTSWTNP